MQITVYKEIQRIHRYAWKNADIPYDSCLWECSHCKQQIELPQQQQFSYCPHCGAKIIKKLGGKVHTNLPVIDYD